MSFGWSAGDIAATVQLLYNIIQALDDVDGAAGSYREAVNFLQDLKRTLEPLQTLAAWNAYPSYGSEINIQLEFMRGPIEEFLGAVTKYEPSLGAKAKSGHHRHVWVKLRWFLFKENKVAILKSRVEGHMRIINILIQRLILDVALKTQETLPSHLKKGFAEVLPLKLLKDLRDHFGSWQDNVKVQHSQLQQHHIELLSYMSENYSLISSDIRVLSEQIQRSMIPRQQAEMRNLAFGDRLDVTRRKHQRTTTLVDSERFHDRDHPESLKDLYILVLLYIGQFLKNLFLALARYTEPSRALMPVLIAKHNLVFLDAIGSRPRLLPFEYFRNLQILRTFIREEFRGRAGAHWVARGAYGLMTRNLNQPLDEDDWEQSVMPGTTILMAMRSHTIVTAQSKEHIRCPELKCSGSWVRPANGIWIKCPMCLKEVLTSTSSIETESPRKRKDFFRKLSEPSMELSQKESDKTADEIDIGAFRRIFHIKRKYESIGKPSWGGCAGVQIVESINLHEGARELGKLDIYPNVHIKDEGAFNFSKVI